MPNRFLIAWLLFAAAANASSESIERADLERKASAGDRSAVHKLCYALVNGEGLPKDFAAAYRWCKEGADLGLASSQTLLGEMHQSVRNHLGNSGQTSQSPHIFKSTPKTPATGRDD